MGNAIACYVARFFFNYFCPMKLFFLLFISFSFAQNQPFIPMDEDTHEFIEEVNYTLFFNKKPINLGITSKDSVTRLPTRVAFDSIAFSKMQYLPTGLLASQLMNVVKLKKTVFELNEVVIYNTKQKEFAIGEKGRFVKRRSGNIQTDPNYGLLIRQAELANKTITRLEFFVEKVKYKTTYKVKFYAAREKGNPNQSQTVALDAVLFEGPTDTLEVGTKGKVALNLDEYAIATNNKDVFVCLELQSYYDENNQVIQPEFKDTTKLKFQLSNRMNYYARGMNPTSKKLTPEAININLMINRDFAFMFFKKPHKSELVAPAIVLYAKKS
ncbi:MAG: hypothetical protein CFE24_03965 [Flavobacterium sp. BFFFF2]|nr:MAG: hypothetical protein CFE24_03965 [Flavobacterium sp. BFFFF2]